MTKRTRTRNKAKPTEDESSLPSSSRQSKTPAEGPAVGYCRPPLQSRFQRGQSGNPKGRRKNSRNFKTLIQQALTGLISIREGDKRRSITKLEGVVLRQ